MTPAFSAAILAGGLSTRMGRDKAFLPHGGKTLVRLQADRLLSLGCPDLILSGRPGVDYAVPEARVVFDQTPDLGPLGGLCAVLEAARHQIVLVVAVDLPALSPAWLGSLLLRCPDGRGCVPLSPQGFEPLAAVYPRALLPQARIALEAGELSLQKLLRTACEQGLMASYPLAPEESPFLANWNQ